MGPAVSIEARMRDPTMVGVVAARLDLPQAGQARPARTDRRTKSWRVGGCVLAIGFAR